MSFYIGEKVLRQSRCENFKMPDEVQNYQSELCLMVWCAWRIELGNSHILAGSGDIDEHEDGMKDGLVEILNSSITNIQLDSFLDLSLEFQNGRRLKVFCDQSESVRNELTDYCYSLFVGDDNIYSVGSGRIVSEQQE